MTLFGPGRGESVVVHLGGGEWLIVDSCVNSHDHPAALAHLQGIGVDASAVRLLVASHWHDDHVRGLASLADSCSDASVVLSTALNRDEFMTLVAADEEAMILRHSGVREMARLMKTLASRTKKPEFAHAERRLYRRAAQPGIPPCEVWTLSPSSGSVLDALAEFANYTPRAGGPRLAVPRPARNPSSVVVWVEVADTRILLGADLERSSDVNKGWTAIVRSGARPPGRAQLVKIPHHGSIDAHDSEMWSELLVPEPHAGITPFVLGSARLPRQADTARILVNTPNAWLTRAPAAVKPRQRPRSVEKTIKSTVRSIERLSVDPGRVTFRRAADGTSSWDVDAPPPARRIA